MKTALPLNVLLLTVLAGRVNAHGYISKPRATYKPNTIYTAYNCLTSASINKGFAGGVYNAEPENNAKQFAEHWNATAYKSLRDMIDPLSPGYGFSLDTAKPIDVSSYTEMWWQNDEYKEGFVESHHGPCEGWIDQTMVFHHDDCAKQFSSYPAKIPMDYSPCKEDKCCFIFYWLALHSPEWQIYKQCVPIMNGGGSGKPSGKESIAREGGAAPPTTDNSYETPMAAPPKTDGTTMAAPPKTDGPPMAAPPTTDISYETPMAAPPKTDGTPMAAPPTTDISYETPMAAPPKTYGTTMAAPPTKDISYETPMAAPPKTEGTPMAAPPTTNGAQAETTTDMKSTPQTSTETSGAKRAGSCKRRKRS